MFKEYIAQLGSQLSLLELSYVALATSVSIALLFRWLGLGDDCWGNIEEEWKRYFREQPWWKSSTAFFAHFILVFVRGAADGVAIAALMLVIAYHIYPELGAIRGS